MSEKPANLLPWEKIPGADLLKGWVEELKVAIAAAEDREWRDTGRAVVLVIDDFERAEAIVRRVAADAGMNFLMVDAKNVIDLAPRTAFRKQSPALLYLEPGDWLQSKQDDDSDEWAEKKAKFQHDLVKWINDFEPAKPLVLVTGNYSLGDMSSEIDKPGSFDRYFVLPPVPFEQRGEEFIEALGKERCGPDLLSSVTKLGKLVARSFAKPWRRDEALLYLRRLHRREKRPLEFADLMHLSVHGFGEEAQPASADKTIQWQTAVHEAGHSLVAIMDSQGKDLPEYCSIMPGAGFGGISVSSINYYQAMDEQTTYVQFRHDIRVDLAGRAAEELVFGPENVSNGASGDLESAWKCSARAFGRWGFAPGMTDRAASASNLAVFVGDPSSTESAHVEALVRRFLTEEYGVVMTLLESNRHFLDELAKRLMYDPIVDQNELAEMVKLHSDIVLPDA
jgi:cell division protease FtsH